MTPTQQRAAQGIREAIVGHQMTERKSRSFHMAKVDEKGRASSYYAYSVTWTPGTIVLAGDLGELTLTQYYATGTFEKAVAWLISADYDYLLGKSDKQRVYNAANTIRELIRLANEEPINVLWGRERWGGGKRSRPLESFSVIDEQRAFRKAVAAGQDPAELDDPRQMYPLMFRKRKHALRRHPNSESELDWWDFDEDVWGLWAKIYAASDCTYLFDLDGLVLAKNRRELRDDLGSYFGTESAAYDYLYGKLGMDDPYVSFEWSERAIMQVEAIQHWARTFANSRMQGAAEREVGNG